jgi:HNH endonuclease
MDLRKYSDQELLSQTKNLIKKEQKLLSVILSHLEEIERRKLYCERGYSSLYDYCLKDLHYSEQQAWRRINAMRVLKTLPELKTNVNEGSLSLSSINMASCLFKEAKINSKEEKMQIFTEIQNLTKTQCEDKIFALRQDYGIEQKPNKIVIKKTSSNSSRVHVNLSNDTLIKIEKIKNLTKENDLDKIISLLADSYISQKIETTNVSKVTAKNSRYIPRKVKETVYKRAGGQCENCGSTHYLEYNHVTPYSKGGTNSLTNINLLCSNCNKRKAIKDFGQEKMDFYLGTLPGSINPKVAFNSFH